MLNCTGFLPGDWKGKTIDAKQDGEKVLVTITGSYEGTIDVRFLLTLSPDGTIDTSYEVMRLYRHMPHKVKAQIGISPGGLLEKGGSWLLAEGLETFCCTDAEGAKARMSLAADAPWQSWHHICEAVITDQKGFGVAVYSDGSDSVRLQKDPMLSPEAVVNDRDGRMHFTGDWHRMEDACGNYRGTETLSRKKETACIFPLWGRESVYTARWISIMECAGSAWTDRRRKLPASTRIRWISRA